MNKIFTLRWHLLLLTTLFFVSSIPLRAQYNVDIGPTTGSSSYYYGPYYRSSAFSSFDYSRYAYLYSESELSIPIGAEITQISWLKASGTITGDNIFDIWLDTTSATSLSSTQWSTLISGATHVYSSDTQHFIAANDAYETFLLDTPYIYNGGALKIVTNHEMQGTPVAANNFYYETATNMAIGWASGTAPSSSTTIGSSSSYNDRRPTIRITYAFTTTCSGQPVAGTGADTTFVCSGDPFALSTTGGTAAGNMSWQWQVSAAGVNSWANLANDTMPGYSAANGIIADSDYRLIVTCHTSTLSDTSNVMKVRLNLPFFCYCIPSNTSNTSYYIDSFSTTGGIQNISNFGTGFTTGGYADYTASDTVSAQPGMTINIKATHPSSTYNYGVWVDWNQDGDFDDVGEEVLNITSYVSSPFTGSFTIPNTVINGATRLRIRNAYIGSTAACGSENYGEAEDYTLVVEPLAPCSSSSFPSSVTASVSADTLCVSGDISLDLDTLIGLSGVSYQWQSAYAATGPWTNLDTAQQFPPKDLTAVDTNTWYRCQLLCNGTPALTSNSLAVHVNNPQILTLQDSASRCGSGTVTFTGTTSTGNMLMWYDAPTGGTALDTTTSFTTPTITTTDTFYAAATSPGGGVSNAIRITEMNVGLSPDAVEIQNVGSSPVDVTGWKVAVSDDYSIVTDVNSTIQTLSGTMQPGDITYWTDLSSNNYWGSNLFFNGSDNGWIIILDNNNNIVDFVAQGWDSATIQSTTLTIGTASISLANAWLGDGFGTGNAFSRKGNSDNDDANDFEAVTTASLGTTNSNLTLPFTGLGGGCESPRLPVIAHVIPLPIVNLGNDTAMCPGIASITINSGNPGASYAWNTGDTTQSISVSSGATYSVEVTSPNGCTASDTLIILNGITPVAVLPNSISLCSGDVDSINAGNAGSTYSWSTGATTQKIGIQTSGDYKVTITSSTGCSILDSTVVAVHPLPVVNLGSDLDICPGNSVNLDAGNQGSTYSWNTSATSQSIMASNSGDYSVLVTDSNGCQNSDTLHLTLNPAPTNVLPDTFNWCTGTAPNLDAGNSGSSYFWSTGAMTQTIPVTASGNFSVTITNSYGCTLTASTNVASRQTPDVALRSDTNICAGETIILDAGAQPNGSSYLWSNGDTSQTTQAFGGGLYSVTITNEYGCDSSDNVHIGLLPEPVVNGINDVQNPDGSYTFAAAVLLNINSITGYNWDFGDGNTATGEHPIHTYNSSGDYIVRLIVTSICGSDTTYKTIRISVTGIGNITLSQSQLKLFPNPATDLIIIKNESHLKMASVQVYNILGQKVLNDKIESSETYQMHTQNLSSGVYQIRINFNDGNWTLRKFEIKR